MFSIRNKAQELIVARRQHPGWRLLAARNAPLTLGCLQTLFNEADDGVETETALQVLSELLAEHANDEDLACGFGDHAAEARKEVREWIQRRLVIERDGRLYATDALEKAFDFLSGLEQRLMTSTASRLSVVQREIESLDVDLNPDPHQRSEHIRGKIAELQQELAKVEAGEVTVLDEAQSIERVRDIYNLSIGLRADFRRVEDSYRNADRALRESIIGSDHSRGDILDELLDGYETLLQTSEGQVFHGFFEQLKQDATMGVTRQRLRSIINHPYTCKALDDAQRSELRWLFVRLNREAETVLRARERSENDVRSFLKTGLVSEHHRVGKLLESLQKVALNIDWEQRSTRNIASCLPPVAVDCGNLPLVERLRIKSLDNSNDQELELSLQQTDLGEIEDDFWLFFDSLDQQALLQDTKRVLKEHGAPLSLSQLANLLPPTHDLETLAFWLGLAREAGLAFSPEREVFEIHDRSDTELGWRFNVPEVALRLEALEAIDWGLE
ncbi:MAG: DUF3375 domain-containing protein [Candidatus Thiodiazotropha sp.]|jgi:hypothetical protein